MNKAGGRESGRPARIGIGELVITFSDRRSEVNKNILNWETGKWLNPPLSVMQEGDHCSPARYGLEVTFTRWTFAEQDRDLHADPPAE